MAGESAALKVEECSASSDFRSVRVDVEEAVDLSREDVVVALLKKAAKFAQERCSKGDFSNIVVVIFHPRVTPWHYVLHTIEWAVRWRNYSATLTNVFERAEYQVAPQIKEWARTREADEMRRSLAEATGREFIGRSIAGFTLGMQFDAAFALLVRGLQEKRLQLLEQEFTWERFMRQGLDPFKQEGLKQQLTTKQGAVVSLRPTRSADFARLIPRFYNERLFMIVVEPHTAGEAMYQGLVSKYGRPLVQYGARLTPIKPVAPGLDLWWRGPESALKWEKAGSLWEDARSTLEYLEHAGGYTLIYQDKTVLHAMWEEVQRQQREAERREQEQTRRQRTLPKQY